MQQFPTPLMRGHAGRVEGARHHAVGRRMTFSQLGARALSLFIAAFMAIALCCAGTATAQDDRDVTRSEIREIQTTLKELGYDAGPSDGLLGPRTRSAIQAFRAANGFETGGGVTQQLLRRVRAAASPQDQPSSDDETDDASREGADSEPGSTEAAGAAETGSEAANTPASEPTPDAPGASDPSEPDEQDGEASEDDAGPAGPTLIGTRWLFKDENGATMRLTFRAEGKIARDGVVARSWSWERSDRSVTITYESGIGLSSTRRGRLVSPDRMRGTGESSGRESWTWTARRLGS